MKNHPLVSTTKYDVNKSIESRDKYHLILAENAIHIATNVKESLERTRDALVEGGMLMLEEVICSHPLYLHGLDKFIWKTATDKRCCK